MTHWLGGNTLDPGLADRGSNPARTPIALHTGFHDGAHELLWGVEQKNVTQEESRTDHRTAGKH